MIWLRLSLPAQLQLNAGYCFAQAVSQLREFKLEVSRLEDENRALRAKLNMD